MFPHELFPRNLQNTKAIIIININCLFGKSTTKHVLKNAGNRSGQSKKLSQNLKNIGTRIILYYLDTETGTVIQKCDQVLMSSKHHLPKEYVIRLNKNLPRNS